MCLAAQLEANPAQYVWIDFLKILATKKIILEYLMSSLKAATSPINWCGAAGRSILEARLRRIGYRVSVCEQVSMTSAQNVYGIAFSWN